MTRKPARERLLGAASYLMYEKGYDAVGVAELCEAAQIKRGSFYFHFESKQALALDMLDRSWRRTRAAFFAESIENDELGAVEAITRYGDLLAEHLAASQQERQVVAGCRFGNFAVELSTRDEVIRARVASIIDEMGTLVAGAIRRGAEAGEIAATVDVERAAARIVACMEGLMVMAKAHQDPNTLRDLGDTARALLVGQPC